MKFIDDRKKSNSQYWLTPPALYASLDAEFNFDFDPCPYPFKADGISIDWGRSNYVNPPFRASDAINGHGPTAFAKKAIEESRKGRRSVLIMPVQGYVNMLLEAGAVMRSAGRVKWVNAKSGELWDKPTSCALFILEGV